MSFLDTTQIHSPGWRKLSDDYYENTVSSRIKVVAYTDELGPHVLAAAEPGTISGDDILHAAQLVMEGRRMLGHPDAKEVLEL